MWPNIAKYVSETLKKPKSQVPTSGYFATLRSAVWDDLIVAKLQYVCLNSICYDVISSEVPRRCSTTLTLHCY